ncbi:MAG: TIGR04190 family B12-binding domain/radical SAM domain protein [Methanophagales archaeon ANME-1-THS]|nr:MAG: TIGR04190 family B12-binding domain/radical SAM domain protein [Methanophagales archaeon ANME-1-THS]
MSLMPQLILLHAPAVYDFRKYPLLFGPIADGVPSTPLFEMYPIGFFSILEYLEQHGIGVRIINLAVRMLGSDRFDAEKMIRGLNPKAFGIDLHWLVHAQGSLEVAKLCKQYHPRIPVIFGGLSATYFHEELIRYPVVDFIIRGDSTEEPLLQLMHAIIHHAHATLSTVPNLVWKDTSGEVHVNPFTHVPTELNECSNNYVPVFKSALKYHDVQSLSPWKGWASHEWLDYPISPVITCRGCIHNCSFCGGSRNALAGYCNRKRPAFRDPQLIAGDIIHIARYTRAPIFIIGDLRQPGEAYATTVLEGLKRAKIKNHLVFELFDAAPKEYFERMADSVEHFNFELSPDSHDERIRAVEGKRYTNAEIEQNIEWALDSGCNRFDLFFMIGLPFQTCESVMETVEWCGYLMKRFGTRVVPFILPYSPFLDPGCPMYKDPEKYGYTIVFKTFEEYRTALLSPSWKYALSYETNWMTRDRIVECTYQAGLRLNKLKLECGLIDDTAFKNTEERITRAAELTARVDEIRTIDDEMVQRERLLELKPMFDTLLNAVINEKMQMSWPAAKRNLRFLPLIKAAIVESMGIQR